MAEIRELAEIPFTGSLQYAFGEYSAALYAISRAWSHELAMAAADAEAAMTELHGNPLLFGLDAKIKARRVAKRIKRAQELADGLTEEAKKFHRAYMRHFVEAANAR